MLCRYGDHMWGPRIPGRTSIWTGREGRNLPDKPSCRQKKLSSRVQLRPHQCRGERQEHGGVAGLILPKTLTSQSKAVVFADWARAEVTVAVRSLPQVQCKCQNLCPCQCQPARCHPSTPPFPIRPSLAPVVCPRAACCLGRYCVPYHTLPYLTACVRAAGSCSIDLQRAPCKL